MKKPTPKLKLPSLKTLAEQSGISEKTLQRYKNAGVDVYDAEAVRAHVAAQKHRPAAVEPAEVRDARARKLNLECDRLEHVLAVAKGKVVSREELVRDVTAYMYRLRQQIASLRGEAPLWGGLEPYEVEVRAGDFERDFVASIYRWGQSLSVEIAGMGLPLTEAEAIAQGIRLARTTTSNL